MDRAEFEKAAIEITRLLVAHNVPEFKDDVISSLPLRAKNLGHHGGYLAHIYLENQYAAEVSGFFFPGEQPGFGKAMYSRATSWKVLSSHILHRLVYAAEKTGFSYLATGQLSEPGYFIDAGFHMVYGKSTLVRDEINDKGVTPVMMARRDPLPGGKESYDIVPRGHVDFTDAAHSVRVRDNLARLGRGEPVLPQGPR